MVNFDPEWVAGLTRNLHYCHELTERLIIPPILNKKYNNYPTTRNIWNLAAKEVQNAQRIIIWGYSFPPTDFYADWLIRQARKQNVLRELILINPGTIREYKSTPNYTFIRRIYDLFRNQLPKDRIHIYRYFDDYINGIDIFSLLNYDRTVFNRGL